MKNKRNYLIIILFGFILISALTTYENIFGSSVDWITQHTIFPDYFRNLFYATKTLIPNLSFNLGSFQNIYNFSYYGLLSPVILISYFLPFIPMKIYICIASFSLYILSGLLIYKLFVNHKLSEKTSLYLSFIFMSLSPLTYHFHYHIMFVWYMPFLIMAFLGVDKYLNDNKSLLLIISIFLLILTNYYYAIPSLVVIAIYGIYSLLKNYDNFKNFFLKLLKAIIRVIVPILLSGIILFPTAYTILNTGRVANALVTIKLLTLFNLKEGMYNSFSSGISLIFLIALIGNLTAKKEKSDWFLNVILLLVTLVPIFMYALNGFLYIRGKILIPFIPLYLIALAKFVSNLKNKTINYNLLIIISSILTSYIVVINYDNTLMPVLILDIIITYTSLGLYKKKEVIEYLLIPALVIGIACSAINNEKGRYILKEDYEYEETIDKEIKKLFATINDSSIYRTDTNINESKNMNKVFSQNHYSTSLYSSVYNGKYNEFYNNFIGNNIAHRNNLMTTGVNNPLFNNLMGIKYIIAKNSVKLDYEVIAKDNHYTLYKNEEAFPIIYKVDNYEISKTKLDWDLKDKYKIDVYRKREVAFKIPGKINGKYLLIKFKMDYNNACSKGDNVIKINGVTNKLTCKDWLYHNNNYEFEYILKNNNLKELDIDFLNGKYVIKDIEIYSIDEKIDNLSGLDNMKIDQGKSKISGDITLDKKTLIKSSIPWDDGFKVFVDKKEVNKKLVDGYFLGFDCLEGSHEILITYNSPWYNIGVLTSILGTFISIVIVIYEKKQRSI